MLGLVFLDTLFQLPLRFVVELDILIQPSPISSDHSSSKRKKMGKQCWCTQEFFIVQEEDTLSGLLFLCCYFLGRRKRRRRRSKKAETRTHWQCLHFKMFAQVLSTSLFFFCCCCDLPKTSFFSSDMATRQTRRSVDLHASSSSFLLLGEESGEDISSHVSRFCSRRREKGGKSCSIPPPPATQNSRSRRSKSSPSSLLPNQQRTLNKLPTELRCRNFVYQHWLSIQISAKHAKTCMQCVCTPTDLPFCIPPLVVGSTHLENFF